MTTELVELAESRGFGLVRLNFDEPQALSAPVARFFRDNVVDGPKKRLVVNMLAPAHVLSTGSVPYWATFSDRK